MTDKVDPIDGVILAFLDYVEGMGPRPTLDHLGDTDRPRAEALLAVVGAGRGIDPHASRPSIEAMLADTPHAGLFPDVSPPDVGLPDASRPQRGRAGSGPASLGGADLIAIRRVLTTVDDRALVDIDRATSTVVYSYLDFRARFLVVAAAVPIVDDAVRSAVEALFDADPDTSQVGVVAAGSGELVTQLLSAEDLGTTITAPGGGSHVRWAPRLPLALAARRLLEQAAPDWPSFDVDRAYGGVLDLPTVAAEIARTIIAREAARSYRGDKKRAYRELVGREQVFAEMVARVSTRKSPVDLDAEINGITRAAA
jgi:hypothetical protein